MELQGYGYAYPGTEDPVLQGVNLSLCAGECHCLTGTTGSGKTTLVQALKGMLGVGRQSGKICFATDPDGAAPTVGLVLQNPETQLFASTVGEEVAFALENRGVDPGLMVGKVRAALGAVGLYVPLDAGISSLSMGQKYRVLVASVLVMEPALLILDEPAAQLDSSGLDELRQILARLAQGGTAILLCEHRAEAFDGLIDRHWHLDGHGRLQPGEVEMATPLFGIVQSGRVVPLPSGQAGAGVHAENLSAGACQDNPLWADANFAFGVGRRVLVQGPNGAGKSTLLRLLSGQAPPLGGELQVLGQKPSLKTLRGRVGFLFQNPQRQLFEDRVIDEVAFALRRHRVPKGERRARVEEVLGQCGIFDLAERSPHRLSFGQKHLVALASVLASDPELLLLDDPFAGLDGVCRQAAWGALMTWGEKPTKTLVWTTHHVGEDPMKADVLLTVEGGRIACTTTR